MSTTQIINLLIEERDKLDAAIRALQGAPDDSKMPDWVRPATKKTPAKKKGVISAAGKNAAETVPTTVSAAPVAQRKRKQWTAAQKKAIGARTKAMWAAKRKAAANKA